jgi:hypothetical protein
MNESVVLRILSEHSKVNSSLDNFVDTDDHQLKPLKHSVLSMAINENYGFDVITEIHKQFPSAVQLPYKKRFLNITNTPVVRTFPFHDLLYARLHYTIIAHKIRTYKFPNVESYRCLYADPDKKQWHTLFYCLLGKGSLDYTEMGKLRHDAATTPMYLPGHDTATIPMYLPDNQLYPLEFVVRLGLGFEYVKTLYRAFPKAIAHNNYAVIFHSLRCRNNVSLYEDVIRYLVTKVKGTILYSVAPWNGKSALVIAEEDNRTLQLKTAIKQYAPFVDK